MQFHLSNDNSKGKVAGVLASTFLFIYIFVYIYKFFFDAEDPVYISSESDN